MKQKINFRLYLIGLLAIVLMAVAFAVPATNASAADQKTKVTAPTAASAVYDGTEKTGTVAESELYRFSPVKGINAGTYYINVELLDKENYCWSDGSTADIKVAFVIEKAVFDVSTLVYEDMTVKYDGENHLIKVGNLPSNAHMLYQTIKHEPGIYDSKAIIDVGANYSNREVEVNATLTILATELESNEGIYSVKLGVADGIDPSVSLVSKKNGSSVDFEGALPKKYDLLYTSAVSLEKDGAAYTLPSGEYEVKAYVPYGYTGIKVLVNEGGSVKEAEVTMNGRYATFKASGAVDFAIIYNEKIELEQNFLWLQILLGVVVVGEAITIVLQALKLKKMK